MALRTRVLIAAVALTCTFAGFGPEALALGRHGSKPPKVQRLKKNSSPYAYLAPQKQKKPTGYYRSTLTGELVYGTPPKR